MWNTILVPHDFSHAADAAAIVARDEAAAHGGKVVLLHVIELPLVPEVLVEDNGAPVSFRDHAIARARERLDNVADALGTTAQTFVRYGRVDEEITRLAREIGADVIVVGAHGHVLGTTTAQRIVQVADVPVLAIPSAA
jgi:nucleotide-binding universal stress UspA family protein